MIPFFTLASVLYRGYRTAKMNLQRANIVASGPPIGSPGYLDLRANVPTSLAPTIVPPGTKYNHLHEVESKDSYRSFARSIDSRYSQSPRAQSLSSRVKTGGKKIKFPKQYKPLRGMKCRRGYKFVSVPGSEVGMCVKQ